MSKPQDTFLFGRPEMFTKKFGNWVSSKMASVFLALVTRLAGMALSTIVYGCY